MINKIIKFVIWLFLLFAFMRCERNYNVLSEYNNPPDDSRIDLEYSAEDTLEAQELGLWFSGELLLSDSVFSEMLYSINYLRYTYGDSFAVLDNRFLPPWRLGVLAVKFDDSTANQVTHHQYTGWNSLENYLQPDTIFKYPDQLGWALLGFDEQLNPRALSEIYSTLPGVIYSEPDGYMFAGGTFPIFPGFLNGEMSYLFVKMSGSYYYFKYIDQEPTFIGYWDLGQPQPPWWDEAENNMENFYMWDGP